MIKKFIPVTLGVIALALLIGASGIMCAMNAAKIQNSGSNQPQTCDSVS